MTRPTRHDHVSAAARRDRLTRRAFLGGAAATIALPWLDAMAPAARHLARAADRPDDRPKRLLCYYLPNGIHMPAWTPATVGPDYDLPPILAPLANVRAKVNVISGLANWAASVPVAGDHARGTGAFLTCVTPEKSVGGDVVNGRSVDQAFAAQLGHLTPFPSLQVATSGGVSVGTCDSGYPCAYSRNISWAGPSTPLPKIISPRLLFDRLFAGADPTATAEDRDRRRRLRKSVLDHGAADATRLQTRLGASDRHKLAEYLQSVRELETRIDALAAAPFCAVPDRPADGLGFPDLVRAMQDLMVLAFRCDHTRVITFMLGDGGSSRSYPFLGIPGAHHNISHHGNNPQNLADLETIGIWELQQFAALLEALDAIDEPGGTALDNSLVYLSSEIGDGDRHNHDNLPVLLAGRAGGQVESGRHLVYPDGDPMADLFLSILRWAGDDAPTFGQDGTRPLPGVLTS
jgi:hypothetical protein